MKVRALIVFAVASIIAGCGSGYVIKDPNPGTGGGTPRYSTVVTLTINTASVYEDSGTTVAVTAKSSPVSDKDILVTLSTSGTASDGVDYTSLNNKTIIIPKGSTTGTVTGTPINDAVAEGNETAVVQIAGVSGGNAMELGDQSVSFMIIEPGSINDGISLAYDAEKADDLAASAEFLYFNSTNQSAQNPIEVINAHKAFGYGLTGKGQVISIIDGGFNFRHPEFQKKTIYTTGAFNPPSDDNFPHGTHVAGYAAAANNSYGMQGVAPEADMHWGDLGKVAAAASGHQYIADHWANITKGGYGVGAVAQNNSWGNNWGAQVDLTKQQIKEGIPAAQAVADVWQSAGYTATEGSVLRYVDALDLFQTTGVVVFSISNFDYLTNTNCCNAPLPEYFPQLEEAWITVMNVDIQGTKGNETYTRMSAPCGDTAPYCLGGDGTEVTAPTWVDDDTADMFVYRTGTGTSYMSPQVSGAVALVAEAFPNQTPEQWTDRLLASADNSFFTPDGFVTFPNGYTHGYHFEYGHGIMDIYAALQPITASGLTMVMVDSSTNFSRAYPLSTSKMTTSASFGDALQQGRQGQIGYTYDDLGGGFAYDMSRHVHMAKEAVPAFDLMTELGSLSPNNIEYTGLNWKRNFDQVVAKFSDGGDLKTTFTVDSTALPVQSFFGSNIDSSVTLSGYQTPYLESTEKGVGIGATYQMGNSRLLLGMTTPFSEHPSQSPWSKSTFAASLEHGDQDKRAVTLMTGITQDKEKMLGSVGTSAFSLSGSKSETKFVSVKLQARVADNLYLTGLSTWSHTDMTSPVKSLVGSSSGVKSSSHAIALNKRYLLGDDNLSFFVTQPNRISQGAINIRIPSLVNRSGYIGYTTKQFGLEPSGREIDYGVSYKRHLSESLGYSFKYVMINDQNHTESSQKKHSAFAGLRYKQARIGVATHSGLASPEFKISYSTHF